MKARELTYAKFLNKFVWKQDPKKWFSRQQCFSIGRLFYVPHGSGELYYIMILLNIARGAKCYEDIRTFDGVLYKSFWNACFSIGLLDDD